MRFIYQKKKNSRCLTISAINMKRKKYRMPKVAVAACLLAIIVPTVGFAGEKIAAYMLPIANPLSYIKEAGEHTEFDWREFERGEQNIYYRDNMPIWISDSEGGSWFYAKKMKKGDSVTLQLGYLVDEDMLDEMVMEFNFGDGRNDGVWRFIDMRSAAE